MTASSAEPISIAQSAAHDIERLPLGYRFHNGGLYWQDPNDEGKPALHLSSAFNIVAETRDGHGASWGLLLHWIDHDGRDHRLAIPRAMLAGNGSEARKTLLDHGMYISPGSKPRQLFNAFLLQISSPARVQVTQRMGWHGTAFVMPDDCYGANADDSLLLQTASTHDHGFRQKGTLEDWQQSVAQYALGNSRLMLAISAAFAGPLLGPCRMEGGGIHFCGASSSGKSTALHVAGSVWGGGDVNGFVRSWWGAANGLEGVALGHSDTLLCLDELSQLTARNVSEAAYMLSNGSGKSRSSRDGSARNPARWRMMFISSGKVGLANKMAEDRRGRQLLADQKVRIIDIPIDADAEYGLFENLHGFETADAFSRHLCSATQQHHGVAARHYLKAIVPGIDEIQKTVTSLMQTFKEKYVHGEADEHARRIAQRFAFIAACGEVAIRAGTLPWPVGDALKAAGRCFEDWLLLRGDIEQAETTQGIEQVRTFLLENGMTRFIPAWDSNSDDCPALAVDNIAGFRRKVQDGWEFYVTTSAWKEICGSLDPRRIAIILEQNGWLITDAGDHRARSIRVPGFSRQRLYHIASSLCEFDEEDEDDEEEDTYEEDADTYEDEDDAYFETDDFEVEDEAYEEADGDDSLKRLYNDIAKNKSSTGSTEDHQLHLLNSSVTTPARIP